MMTSVSLSGWILLFGCLWSNLHCITLGESSRTPEGTPVPVGAEDPAANANSTCSISIINRRATFTSTLYQRKGADTGSTLVTFSASPDPVSPSNPCYISTDTIAEEVSFIHGFVQLYLILECSANTRLRIQIGNQSELKRQENTLMTLHIRRCVLDVADVGRIGRIARLDAILLKDTTMTEDSPGNRDYAGEFLQLRSLVFVFSLRPAPVEVLPLNSSYFSNISKLGLQSVRMKSFPDYLSQQYPNLLSLTLISCSLDHPPAVSLDFASQRVLPMGLSLTKNEVYRKFQNGIYQSPNIVPRVLKLVYNKLDDLSSYRFHGILHSLVLNSNQIRLLGKDTFSSVKGLQSIHISGNMIRSLPEEVFSGLADLILIDLSQNGLRVLHKNQFKGLANLRILNLEANALTSIHVDTFSYLTNIAILNIGWNKLRWLDPGTLPIHSPYFASLSLGKNPLEHVNPELFFTSSLKHIDLSFTGISFEQILIDLENTTLEKLMFLTENDLDSTQKPTLNLAWNNIQSFPSIVEAGRRNPAENNRNSKLINIMNRFCVDLTGNNLQCNCDLAVVVGVLGMHQVKSYNPLKASGSVNLNWDTCYRGWKCGGPGLLHGVGLSSINPLLLYCPLNTSDCPEQCDCNVDFNANITMDCSERNLDGIVETLPEGTIEVRLQNNNIKEMPALLVPEFDRVKTLILSNNSVEELPDYMFISLPELTVLYLDDNNLSRLPKTLKKSQITDLKLSGNPFSCDCDNKWIKQWLLQNKEVVQDWDKVECLTRNNTLLPMAATDDSTFGCPPQPVDDTAQIVTLAVVLTVMVVVMVILCYFHKQLRACLFVHVKLSLCGKQMSPVSLFLVNSVEDEAWVEKKLTSAVRKYPTCEKVVSIRDFRLGFPTKDNILTFLQNNSVTVLLVSDAFFRNDMCKEILKTLSERAGKSMGGRIVVIMKGTPVLGDNDGFATALKDVCSQSLQVQADTCAFKQLVIHAVLSAPRHDVKQIAMNKTGREPQVVIGLPNESGHVSLDDVAVDPFLYDVSMVYGDSDAGLVLEQLLPQFTGHGYRVGIPDREFLPGFDHAENIESLLVNSRKLVYFLSESLVQDEWSSFTFKLAMDLNSTRGSNYIYVVLGDDVQKDSLDGDLLVYTENHVCLPNDRNIGAILLEYLDGPSGVTG